MPVSKIPIFSISKIGPEAEEGEIVVGGCQREAVTSWIYSGKEQCRKVFSRMREWFFFGVCVGFEGDCDQSWLWP